MAIPQPTIGFRFDAGSTNEVFGAGALTLAGGASIVSGGLQCDNTSERASLVIPSGACPSSWAAMTIWVKCAIAQSSYHGVFGIGRGAATGSPQYTAAMQFSSGGTLLSLRNNTAGSATTTSGSLGAIDRGTTTTDYSDTQHLFIVYTGGLGSGTTGDKGYKDSSTPVTYDTGGTAASTAPLYSTPTIYFGSLPHDNGNPRIRFYAAAVWANALSTTQIDEVIADTAFNFLVAPQRVQRVVQVVRRRTPAHVLPRQLVTAQSGSITSGGGGGAAAVHSGLAIGIPLGL